MRLGRIALVLGASLLGSAPNESMAGKTTGRAQVAAGKAKERLGESLKKKGLTFGSPVYLRLFKEEAELELWMRGSGDETFTLAKTYPICASSGELGPKQKQGDEQSPEGFYSFGAGSLNPHSSYHLSFDIGYPNAYDRALGRTGSLIMVHGDCVSIGCFAMTDDGIDEIYSLADAAFSKGQKRVSVHVFPFRMTQKKMRAHAASAWASFWHNLREGYDAFEKTKVPPTVTVEKGRYVIGAP